MARRVDTRGSARERNSDKAKLVRQIFLGLPDTEETPTWGSPHFRVAGKIFGGLGEEGETISIGFKLEMEHAAALVSSDPRFTRAPYVGHKGWVSMDLSGPTSWDEVRALVGESYRLIAPKRSLAKLTAGPAPAGPSRASSAPAPRASAASPRAHSQPRASTQRSTATKSAPPAAKHPATKTQPATKKRAAAKVKAGASRALAERPKRARSQAAARPAKAARAPRRKASV
jgi:predicted DNA-binding protein (MmcQ/YjbR family)